MNPEISICSVVLTVSLILSIKNYICFASGPAIKMNEDEARSHYLLIFKNSSLKGNFFNVKPFRNWPQGILRKREGYQDFKPELVCLKGAWIFYSGKYLTGDNEMIYGHERSCYNLSLSGNLSSVRYIPLSPVPVNDRNGTFSDEIHIFRRSYLHSYFGEESIFTFDNSLDKDIKLLETYEGYFDFPPGLDMFFKYNGDFSQIVMTSSSENTAWTLYDQPNFGIQNGTGGFLTTNPALTSVCLKHGLNLNSNANSERKETHQSLKIISFSTSLFKFNIRSVRKGCHSKNITFLNRVVTSAITESKSSENSLTACTKSKIRIINLVGAIKSEESSLSYENNKIGMKNHTISLLDQLLNSMQTIFNQACDGPGSSMKKETPNNWVHPSFLPGLLKQFLQKCDHLLNNGNAASLLFSRGLPSFLSRSIKDLQLCSKNASTVPLFSISNKSRDEINEIDGYVNTQGNQIFLKSTDFIETVELTNLLDPVLEAIWFVLSINLGICSSISPGKKALNEYLHFYENFVASFIKPLAASWIQKPECGVKNYENNWKLEEMLMLDNIKLCNVVVYMTSRNFLQRPVRPIEFQWQGRLIKNTVLVPKITERNINIPR